MSQKTTGFIRLKFIKRLGGFKVRNNTKKTHNTFIKQIYNVNPNIEILSEYINARTVVKCRCKIDSHEWETTPDKLLNSRTGCPLCAKKRRDRSHKKMTHEEFIAKSQKFNPTIEIKSKYSGINNKVDCYCTVCGGEFTKVARNITDGSGCPICSGALVAPGINDIANILRGQR